MNIYKQQHFHKKNHQIIHTCQETLGNVPSGFPGLPLAELLYLADFSSPTRPNETFGDNLRLASMDFLDILAHSQSECLHYPRNITVALKHFPKELTNILKA
jgi:hypothetical protein